MAVQGFRFGSCEVRPITRELIRDGLVQDVEPRVFDLLVYLITNADRVIGKDELLDQVGGRRIVSDSVVARTVMKARRAIGDDASEPEFIVTQHGYGYRFIGALAAIPAESGGVDPAAEGSGRAEDLPRRLPSQRISGLRWLAIAGLLVLAVGAWFLIRKPTPPATPPRMIVLPIANLTGEDGLDWTRLGLMSVLSGSLSGASRVEQVPTAELSAAMEAIGAADTSSTLAEKERVALGKQLATGIMVQGQLRKTGDQFHLDIDLFRRDRESVDMTLSGPDPVALAVRASTRIAESMGIPRRDADASQSEPQGSYVGVTYARAMDALAREHFVEAIRLLDIVVDAGGGELQPRLDLARALMQAQQNERALEIATDLISSALARKDHRTRAAALLVKSDALYRLGEFDDAESSARQALNLALPEYREIKPDAELQLSVLFYARLQQEQAKALAQAAIVGYQRMGSDYRLAGAYLQLGRVMQRLDVPNAVLHYNQALELAQRSGRTSVQADALTMLADANRLLGDCTMAFKQLDQAVQLAVKIESPRDQARAYVVRGRCEKQSGQLDAAIESMRKATELAESADEPRLLATALLNLAGTLAQKQGTPVAQTEELYLRAAELYEEHGQPGAAAGTLMNVAQNMIGNGRYGQAESLLRRIDALSAGIDDPAIMGGAHVLRAMLAYRQGHVADAAQAMQQAHAVAGANTRTWVETGASLIWLQLELGDIEKAESVATSMATTTAGYPSLCLARTRLLYEQGQFHAALESQDACLAELGSAARPIERAYREAYVAAVASGKRESLPEVPPSKLWL